MSLIKVHENNTFQWKVIHDDYKSEESDEFTIGGHRFSLLYTVPPCDAIHNSLYYYPQRDEYDYDPQPELSSVRQFCLVSHDSSFLPFSYTISISDREGQDFICTKGKFLKEEDEWSLMILDHDNLMERNIIDDNSFTVRLSINHELDDRETPSISKERESNVPGSTANTNPPVTKDSGTNTDVSVNFLETLSNDFSAFYENKTDTDCVLNVNGDQVHVHRAVLSARSSVFSAMFHHDTAENRSGEVNIPDVNATTLSDVLYYVYSGKVKGLTADTATSIYTAADKYDLLELRTKCLEFLKQEVTLENFCEVALLAHTHGEIELEERVVWFIEENLDEVLESSAWQQFLKDKSLLANKFLTSAFKASKKKQFRHIPSK